MLAHLPKLNIGLLRPLLLNILGYNLFFMNLVSLIQQCPLYIVTTLILPIYVLIQFFTHEWNILPLISTSWMIRFKMVVYMYLMSHLEITLRCANKITLMTESWWFTKHDWCSFHELHLEGHNRKDKDDENQSLNRDLV